MDRQALKPADLSPSHTSHQMKLLDHMAAIKAKIAEFWNKEVMEYKQQRQLLKKEKTIKAGIWAVRGLRTELEGNEETNKAAMLIEALLINLGLSSISMRTDMGESELEDDLVGNFGALVDAVAKP